MIIKNNELEENSEFLIKDNIIIGKNADHEPEPRSPKLLLDALDKDPDFIAQIDVQSGETLTFAQIKDLSIRCALWLKKQNVGKGDIICVSTPNQMYDCIPCLATLFAGAIFNPWYYKLTRDSARYFFEMMKPKIMFACEESINLLVQVAKEAQINCKFVTYKKHSAFQSLHDITKEQTQIEVDNFKIFEPKNPKQETAVILFSSGTTGAQKGTMLSYNTLLKNRNNDFHTQEKMVALWYSALNWISGTYFTIFNIMVPLTRIIHAELVPDKIGQVIQKYKVNWVFLLPMLLTQVCKEKVFDRYNFTSLKVLMTGGLKAYKSVLEEVQESLPSTLINYPYGLTESGFLVTAKSRTRKLNKKIDSVGFVSEGYKVKIVDINTGETLGPNQLGEICCKSHNLMLGYYNRPEETNKKIDGEGWLHTEDLGYFDENGEISIADRITQVIINHNHKILPSQIEEILLQHPDVIDATVVPVPHSIDIQRPLAFVIRAFDAKVTEDELIELPTSVNKLFKLTGGVVFVDKIPFTSTGKKSIKELKEMAKIHAQ